MTLPTPSILFGPIFAAVQKAAIFPDSKTFADAVPRREMAAILIEWENTTPCDRPAIASFVDRNFVLPAVADEGMKGSEPIEQRIAAIWPLLTRRQETAAAGSSEISLPRPFLVPGGRFRELYYWDTYFTLLGLVRSERHSAVEDAIANMGSLFERYGRVPNGTRTYYLTRSHPPFFHLIAGLSKDRSEAARRQRLEWMRIEHDFWMKGADQLRCGEEDMRVVRLKDGSLLNRYWDDADQPRDESWREDIELAAGLPEAERPALWRDIRAAAESGWDFSSRWLRDGRNLATIRTTRIVPIDLNCLMFGLEQAIAREASELHLKDTSIHFAGLAKSRAAAIADNLWNEREGFFADYDLERVCVSNQLTAATAFALFTGVCDKNRAGKVGDALQTLLRRGGLATTMARTDQQWDAPNGWAPLQWVAIEGLKRFDMDGLAEEISARWIALLRDHYGRTGIFLEKYDVERGQAGFGGEYVTEVGFGWTNGVTLELSSRS